MINFAKINIVFHCVEQKRCKGNTLVAVQNKGVDSLISFFWTRCGEFFSFEKLITRSSAKLQIEIFPLLEITIEFSLYAEISIENSIRGND